MLIRSGRNRQVVAIAMVGLMAAVSGDGCDAPDSAGLGEQLGALGSANIVISQVYGGGGNSGAKYKNDFIEVFNRGTTAVSLSGWSVQYASASGSSWQVTTL